MERRGEECLVEDLQATNEHLDSKYYHITLTLRFTMSIAISPSGTPEWDQRM